MARSPFTLAAVVTAAVPGAQVVGARPLSADGDARFDSAVASLAGGDEVAIRVASDDETSAELSAEAIALRALTAGARNMLPFRAPEVCGETRVDELGALVTTLLPGYQVEAADIPAGRGAATAIGAALAGLHALPSSVVRAAGLAERTPEQARDEIRSLIDRAAATGRVSARLTVRWREAVDADELWRFEPAVTLGGAQSSSFLFEDTDERGPRVTGVIGWHGLSIGDPAVDLAWLAGSPDSRDDVHASYADAALRSPDAALAVRARMLAELEFARWLLHGHEARDESIVSDAAALLDALADGIHDDLAPRAGRGADVDAAMDALDRVPVTAATDIDTSMQTDTYDPSTFAGIPSDDTAAFGPRSRAAAASTSAPASPSTPVDHEATGPIGGTPEDDPDATAELGDLGLGGFASDDEPRRSSSGEPTADHSAPEDEHSAEAQRAARAAFQRWSSSASE